MSYSQSSLGNLKHYGCLTAPAGLDLTGRLVFLFWFGQLTLSDELKGGIALAYIALNVWLMWSTGRWIRRRWLDQPLAGSDFAIPFCGTFLFSVIAGDALLDRAVFLATGTVLGWLPLAIGLGCLNKVNLGEERAQRAPGRARRIISMVATLFLLMLGLSIASGEGNDLSKESQAIALLVVSFASALLGWLAGRYFRRRWAAAPAARSEILASIGTGALVWSPLFLWAPLPMLAIAAGIYVVVIGLPFAVGMGLFSRTPV